MKQAVCEDLSNFIINKEREILDIAKRQTEDIVKTELALTDFELLLSVNTSKGEIDKLNKTARKLRKDNWDELRSQFKGDHNAIMNHLRDV